MRAAAPRVTLSRVWFFRRKPRERPFDEATAYARLHGDRDELVRIVELPPRRKRYRDLLASGEQIRRGFERKLDEREPEPDEVSTSAGSGSSPSATRTSSDRG